MKIWVKQDPKISLLKNHNHVTHELCKPSSVNENTSEYKPQKLKITKKSE